MTLTMLNSHCLSEVINQQSILEERLNIMSLTDRDRRGVAFKL